MRYTFADAKRILTAACHSNVTDIGDKINTAIRALCDLNPWEHDFLRQVVRMASVDPVISLPQGATGLVRACVNGEPVTLHGQDFQFMSSGPGDLDHIRKPGFHQLPRDVRDLGMSPVWTQPKGHGFLCAAYKGSSAQPAIRVKAIGIEGDVITFSLTPQADDMPLTFDANHPVRTILEVIVDDATTNYISLFMTGVLPCTHERMIARYHPNIRVPEFRRYALPIPCGPRFHRGPYDILAEVQFEPLDLVADDDVVPFPTLEPIKSMILYEYSNQNLETQAAETYMKQAANWVASANERFHVHQGPVVPNIPYAGSMGQLSDELANL